MKLIRLLVILCVLILFTGCNTDYNLLVNHKGEVVETVSFIRPNEEILQGYESVKLYLYEQVNVYKDIPKLKDYRFIEKENSVYSSITIIREYDSLYEFKLSPLFELLFEDAVIISNFEFTSVNTIGDYYYDNLYGADDNPDPTFYIGDIDIKIKFYNNIIDSNADEFNEKENTLLWSINSNDKEKNIYFKIGNQIKYDIIVKDLLTRNQTTITIILSLLTIILILSIYIYIYINKKNAI